MRLCGSPGHLGPPPARRRWFPFEFGAFGPLAIRFETISLGLRRPLRLLYASDLHLGHWWTWQVPHYLLAAARQAGPALILLGGDIADHPGALPQVKTLTRELRALAPVYAIPGNHDTRASIPHLRGAIESAGGSWLPHHPIEQEVHIEATLHSRAAPVPRILCAHFPSVFPQAVAAGYNLVLAGHLHGGQCVLGTYQDKLYPAVWFQRWHGLRFRDHSTTMIVSRGVADTFPLRFNCPREVILCAIC